VSFSWKRVKQLTGWIISGYQARQCSEEKENLHGERLCKQERKSPHMLFSALQVGLQL